jgi:transposase
MKELPDLSRLSVEEKDELIITLWQQNQVLMPLVEPLQARVAELEGRLNKNSRNSSKPPSSDGFNKPAPKSLRKPGQKPSGGQKGHKGTTLERSATPDHLVVHHVPEVCDACQQKLPEATEGESRQVFEVPLLRYEVIEHRQMRVRCNCGKDHQGLFPEHVRSSVQYGPRALATMVYLNQYHLVPLKRTAGLMRDLFGLSVSEATVHQAGRNAGLALQPQVDQIAVALQSAAVAHADETGLRVNTTLHWLHTLVNESLTWMACHAKRGQEAFEALNVLPNFLGTLIHDGFGPYRTLKCQHGLCNARHLRELTYLHEQQKQAWAGEMIDLLTQANQETQGKPTSPVRLAHWRYVYTLLLDEGDRLNPRQASTGKRGRVKQSKAANLIARLRTYADDVWRFASEVGVPFTNNLAEQAIRMPKVKQKISGCFRKIEGALTFCVIRSYLATLNKQGVNLFDALVDTFFGTPPQPAL